MGDPAYYMYDRRSAREREKCPVCEKPYPSIDHPSFQHCAPYLVERIKRLENDTVDDRNG